MKAADLLITDGSSDTSQADELRARASVRSVNILGVGIGVGQEALTPWCSDLRLVRALDVLSPDALEVLAEI